VYLLYQIGLINFAKDPEGIERQLIKFSLRLRDDDDLGGWMR